eukprot:m.1582645 g.1582645  ORF g.1582645 m.1582645 type:complete len:308 (+) comp25318_c0_seq26:236-1159(+)
MDTQASQIDWQSAETHAAILSTRRAQMNKRKDNFVAIKAENVPDEIDLRRCVDESVIREMCSAVHSGVTQGAPYPMSLAIHCVALSRCIAFYQDAKQDHESNVHIDQLYQDTLLLPLIKYQHDVHSRLCRKNWFTPALWAAFIQLRVVMWCVQPRVLPEVVHGIVRKKFFPSRDLMIHMLLTGSETMADVLTNPMYPLHIRIGAMWSFSDAIQTFPQDMPAIYEHANLFPKVLRLLSEVHPEMCPATLAGRIPPAQICDDGCTNLDSIRHVTKVTDRARNNDGCLVERLVSDTHSTWRDLEFQPCNH